MKTLFRTVSRFSMGMLCIALGLIAGDISLLTDAVAQESPAQKRPAAWYPRTEKLGPDEMFVVALGTGMPTPITRAG